MDVEKIVSLTWRKFLSTDAGVKGMLVLRECEPRILKSSSPEEMIYDAGRNEGYRECLRTITDLIALEQVKEQKADND